MKGFLRSMAGFLVGVTGAAVVQIATAAETDNFTRRGEPLPDATEILNRKTDALLEAAIAEANRKPAWLPWTPSSGERSGCSYIRLYHAVHAKMGGPLVGVIEEFANQSEAVSRRSVLRQESIYRAFELFETPSFSTRRGRLASVVNIGGTVVGADKLGHFFSQGYSYFKKAYSQHGGIAAALQYGDWSERTYYGALVSGIYSYGDLVANFNGMRFWVHLVDGHNDPLGGSSEEPYVACVDGRWVKQRDFDWRDYIDPAWDEAINCSLFRNESLMAKVEREIAELRIGDRDFGGGCPLSRRAEGMLRSKYGRYFDRLVNLQGHGTVP